MKRYLKKGSSPQALSLLRWVSEKPFVTRQRVFVAQRSRHSSKAPSLSTALSASPALKRAFAGKLFAIPGFTVKAGILGAKLVPDRILGAITYNIQRAKRPVSKTEGK